MNNKGSLHMNSKLFEIINNNHKKKGSYKVKIKPSKTEIHLIKNLPPSNRINSSNNNDNSPSNDIKTLEINHFYYDSRNKKQFDNLCINTLRNTKLNYTDLYNYMNKINSNNINTTRIKDNKNKPNKLSLNKYFNLDKINRDKKIITNNFDNSFGIKRSNFCEKSNNISNINNSGNTNVNKKPKIYKYNSYINKKKKNIL